MYLIYIDLQSEVAKDSEIKMLEQHLLWLLLLWDHFKRKALSKSILSAWKNSQDLLAAISRDKKIRKIGEERVI